MSFKSTCRQRFTVSNDPKSSTNTDRSNTAGSHKSPEFWLFQAPRRSRVNTPDNKQGRRESNSQPLVLETSALPIELRPCVSTGPGHPNPAQVTFLTMPTGLATEQIESQENQSRIFVTTPDPTVRPPSRIAKRTPSSIAIGTINSTSILTLSPGETISTPPISFVAPVTSVVLK